MTAFFAISLLGFILGCIIGYIDYPDFVVTILGGLLGLFIGALLGLVVVSIVDGEAEAETYKNSEEAIYALQDGSSVEGSFFLGSGVVDGNMKYTYLTETSRGKLMRQVNADKAYVNEVDNEKPKIVHYYKEIKNDFLRKYFSFGNTYSHSEITIPKNSIKQNFTVDLE